jgi:hypothetical protein
MSMDVRLLCALAALTFTSACMMRGEQTPPFQLQVYSAPAGVTATLADNGQSCQTPCAFPVDGAKIQSVSFVKPGCLKMTQLTSPRIIDVAFSPEDRRNYALSPNPLMAKMVCG